MLRDVAARFAPIGLDELGDARLMERVDRKFVIPSARIENILDACAGGYRVLDIGGVRLSRYSTRYFDTPDLAMYHAHHADRTPRSKVRVREYVDSGLRFMELKRRANTGRTHKTRIPMGTSAIDALCALRALPEFAASGLAHDAVLQTVLDVSYSRLTLVRTGSAERVTVDVGISFLHGDRTAHFPGVVFAEVKQARIGPSPFVDAVRAARLREGAVSKYCIGVASLVAHARKNRFLRTLAQLHDASVMAGRPLASSL